MYAYDPQLSIQLAKNHPELFEMRACYNNVYNMVMQHLEELTPWEKLRILFCYRKGNGDEYYRHAFCLFDGKLVEPLLYLDMSDYNRRASCRSGRCLCRSTWICSVWSERRHCVLSCRKRNAPPSRHMD